MNNSRNPLRLNVGYLYNKSIGTSREVEITDSQLRLDDLVINELESLVRISRTREGLLLQVTGGAKLETTCVRCLKVFFLPVGFNFEELYQFPSRHREETDLILPYDGYIDLRILYREYLILAMPIKHLCQPDCKGLCDICGVNLNEMICEHHHELQESIHILEGEETG